MTVLLVVATIVLFLLIDWGVRSLFGREAAAAARSQAAPRAAYPLRAPEGIFFARSHTWLNLWPSGKVRLGVDDFVGALMDSPHLELLKAPGDKVAKGEPLIRLSQGERSMTVRSPIAGSIVSTNPALEEDPRVMREALFSDGWAYTIQPARLEEIRNLLLGAETREWLAHEFGRFREFVASSMTQATPAGAVLQDGGFPAPGALKNLDAGAWKKFEQMFLEPGN